MSTIIKTMLTWSQDFTENLIIESEEVISSSKNLYTT